jgi:hypothetical protein
MKITLIYLGVPRPYTQKIMNNWPCNPEKTLVSESFKNPYLKSSVLNPGCSFSR